jgi:hypothetical protein
VHTVQLLLILLMAVAVYWLTEGLTGPAAQSSRVALLFYLVFYSAFDSVVASAMGSSRSTDADSRPPSRLCCRV